MLWTELLLGVPWRTEVGETNTLGKGTWQSGLWLQPEPGGPGPRPRCLASITFGRALVPRKLGQTAASRQAPVSALSPLIGHLARAKSQLRVSPVGDLSNESCKAGGGWGCWGCHCV